MIRTSLFFMIFLTLSLAHSQESIVGNIDIRGAKRTEVAFLESLIKVRLGAAIDSTILREDIERLKRLPSVSDGDFQVSSSEDGKSEVVYTIEENFTLIPYANLFSSSNDAFAFRVGLQEFNFLGRGITLGGFYQYDVYNSYGASIRAPYLFGPKVGLVFDYKDLTTLEPIFFDGVSADYRYRNTGFELLGMYEFNFRNRIAFGGSLFTEEYEYLTGATNEEVPQALKVKKHLLKFIYNFDNVKYYHRRLEGFRSSLNLQYVGSSDANLPKFLIGFNDFVYYRRMFAQGVWASRLRLGLASNIATPFAPFTVDNNINIRGVGNTIDRGTATIVFNTEYRHTLIDKGWFALEGNVFFDGGTWRNPGGGLDDLTNSQNIRIYPGVGLRFIHKRIFNAVFRIDYGYGITNDASRGLVFGIGQYF